LLKFVIFILKPPLYLGYQTIVRLFNNYYFLSIYELKNKYINMDIIIKVKKGCPVGSNDDKRGYLLSNCETLSCRPFIF